MPHNLNVRGFAEVQRWISSRMSVLVRPFAGQHNIHLRTRKGTGTPVSLGRGSLGTRVTHNLVHRTFERPVQAALVGAEPFYSDVNRVPLALELDGLPVVDRVGDIPRPTVAEVQPRPSQVAHAATLLHRTEERGVCP